MAPEIIELAVHVATDNDRCADFDERVLASEDLRSLVDDGLHLLDGVFHAIDLGVFAWKPEQADLLRA